MEKDKIPYTVIYRDIRYPRIEMRDGYLVLILPYNTEPKEIIKRHKKWILDQLNFIDDMRKRAEKKRLSYRTSDELKELIQKLIEKFSNELGVCVKRIYFRRMKSKWASISPSRNLVINSLISFLPDHLIEYIIYHEMVHLIERRHNKRFKSLISRRYREPEELEKELFVFWFLIRKEISVLTRNSDHFNAI